MVRGIGLVAACAVLAAGSLAAQQVYRGGQDGVTLPVPLTEVKPSYTAAALQARIEGAVLLEAVVRADGSVGDVKIVESLDTEHGLDEQAIGALRQWEFKPGTRDGKPVSVIVEVSMNFTLR